jgi:hypothetical protein
MRWWQCALVGAIGGLVAAISKMLAIDAPELLSAINRGLDGEVTDAGAALFITTPLLVMLGAIVCAFIEEDKALKVLAIGCSAPALVAPWTSGSVKPSQLSASNTFVSSAYAQSGNQSQIAQSGFSLSDRIEALSYAFGIKKIEDKKYWVIVGSFKSYEDAKEKAQQINKLSPELNALATGRRPGNQYYPVIVGGQNGPLKLDEARNLATQATESPAVSESYLSAYTGDRLPTNE